jgi:hypothetical protein
MDSQTSQSPSGLKAMNDLFFQKLVEDNDAAGEMLNALLGRQDLQVETIYPQTLIADPGEGCVRIGTIAKVKQGGEDFFYSLTLLHEDKRDPVKLARIINDLIADTSSVQSGKTVSPDRIASIFLTESDLFGAGKPKYETEMKIRGSNIILPAFKPQQIFINAQIDNGSSAASLMQILSSGESCSKGFPAVSARLIELKENGIFPYQKDDRLTGMLDYEYILGYETAKTHYEYEVNYLNGEVERLRHQLEDLLGIADI